MMSKISRQEVEIEKLQDLNKKVKRNPEELLWPKYHLRRLGYFIKTLTL